MKQTLELSPVQLGYFQSTKVVSQTLANQVAAIGEQIAKLKEEADGLARNGDRQFTTMLEAIAADHGVDKIPSDAQITVTDGVTVFSWDVETPAETAEKVKPRRRRSKRNGA